MTPETLTPDQLALYRAIVEGPRAQGPRLFDLVDGDGALLGPFGGFLLSPAIGDALQRVGAAVRYEGRLGDRARELAILAVAARSDCSFERHAHEAVGRACGLTDAEITAVRSGEAPPLTDDTEAAVLRMTSALLDGDVDDETWASCVPPLDVETVFELIALVGYYSTLALQMRVLRTDVVPGDR